MKKRLTVKELGIIFGNIGKILKHNIGNILIFEIIYKFLPLLLLGEFSNYVMVIVKSMGFKELTQQNFLEIFKYPRLIIILGILLGILILYAAYEITFIFTAFKTSITGEKLRFLQLAKRSFVNAVNIFKPSKILVVPYFLLILVFSMINFTTEKLNNVKIQGFIIDHFLENKTTTIIYLSATVFFTILSIFSLFVVVNIFIDNDSFRIALTKSVKTVKKYFKKVILGIIVMTIINIFLKTILFYLGLEVSYWWYRIFEGMVGYKDSIETVSSFLILYIPMCIIIFDMSFIMSLNSLLTNRIIKNIKYELRIKKVLLGIVTFVVIFTISLVYLEFNIDKVRVFRSEDRPFPRIIAHRAGGFFGAENTIQGLEVTKEFKVSKEVEIDVQLTKDKEVILLHDSNFKKVINLELKPEDLTWEEIRSYSKGYEESKNLNYKKIVSLKEFLDAAKDMSVIIELKGPKYLQRELVEKVIEIVKDKNFTEKAIIGSLDKEALEIAKSIHKKIPTCYFAAIYLNDKPEDDFIDIYAIESSFINNTLMFNMHDNNKKVLVWTVNQMSSLYKVLPYEVDGIITDNILLTSFALTFSKEYVLFQDFIINNFKDRAEVVTK